MPNYTEQTQTKIDLIKELKQQATIAEATDKANEQHYEIPTSFFQACLGNRLKYSSCYYKNDRETLSQAEENMLELYCERAQLRDGLKMLDLGCGWGSLSLFLAEKYPNSSIYSFSNSSTQREHIESEAVKKGLKNIKVVTGDINTYEFVGEYTGFDRILSIEMVEHLKNYRMLLKKMNDLLKDEQSLLFLHFFCHKSIPYPFLTEEDHSWMAKYFFTGGMMPSFDLFLYFQEDLNVVDHWYVNGKHYSKTCEEWLKNMDGNKTFILEEFKKNYGKNSFIWFQRWRLFYLACSETFNYNQGETWGVAHFLFKKK
ncbi:S-adenosyl-L-methionine-dependent methyltransferase [Neoconidiobolus thromboides FSU 785]|nr:S-adenosyl-L-methionine-dependent methyltransferase [Neoconidiobolus thromboides FSU 785]